MDSEIMVECLPILGLCNLCLQEGAVQSMITSHLHNGIQEMYSEMLIKCFSIDISLLELGDTKRLICTLCSSKLREAVNFRDQVETALHTLQESVQFHDVKKEEKLENGDMDDATLDNDFTCDDILAQLDNEMKEIDDFKVKDEEAIGTEDLPLILLKRRKEHRSKRKSKNLERTPPKEAKLLKYSMNTYSDFHETEVLIKAGLFPFKIRQNGSYSCAICSEKSKHLDRIKDHCLEHSKKLLHIAFKKMIFHSKQRFFKADDKLRCKICTTDIAMYDELKSHIQNCTRLKFAIDKWNHLPFKLEKDQLDCPVCKKTFRNYVSLNTHMNVHYPNYICENCGKAFATKGRLRGHIRTHEIGEFPCRYCHLVFDKVTKRENHVSKEHKSGVRYACRRCNISLTSFYARQKHLAEVHNEELKRYKCQACPQSYITPGHLSSHVRRDHLNERNHKCDKCDLAFYTKNALKMHMIKHDGERIHSCPVCAKSYQRKKTLREHMRIHDNDKRFVCPVCGRAFTQKCTLKGHLKVHERKVDVDERIGQALRIE